MTTKPHPYLTLRGRLEAARSSYRCVVFDATQRWDSRKMKYVERRKPLGHPSFSQWLRSDDGRDRVRGIMASADEHRTIHLRRDYRVSYEDDPPARPKRWTIGMPIVIGSGRSADWLHIGYLIYAHTAQLLHRRLGWSGQRMRDAARALHSRDGTGIPEEPLPVREILAMATMPPSHYQDLILAWERTGEASPHTTAWRMWRARIAQPAWGRWYLDHVVARLQLDPDYKTPSMIVGEIRRLRGDDSQTDFRGCSGCEVLRILHERSDLHDLLLSRAATFTPCTVAGRIEAVLVPFGLPYPPEYDYCHTLGLSYEIRIRSSDWDARQAIEAAR